MSVAYFQCLELGGSHALCAEAQAKSAERATAARIVALCLLLRRSGAQEGSVVVGLLARQVSTRLAPCPIENQSNGCFRGREISSRQKGNLLS
jgi:hypothetical protein